MRESIEKPKYIPENIEYSKDLVDIIRKCTIDQIQEKMKINEKIALQVKDMYKNIKFDINGYAAIDSFDGLQYKRLNYRSLGNDSKEYINKNILIYTGLYGMIRPLDSIYPHRLDFDMKFDLYNFWKDILAKQLPDDDILDISSNEFMKAVDKYMGKNYYKVFFKEYKNGKLISKATESKIMRGNFTRYLAENKINKIKDMLQYNDYGYKFIGEIEKNEIIFIKK